MPSQRSSQEDSGVDPSSYRMEMNQSTNTNVVCVQAPLQVTLHVVIAFVEYVSAFQHEMTTVLVLVTSDAT